MITVSSSGSFKNTEAFLRRMKGTTSRLDRTQALDKYGIRGVDALSAATPIDTSETSKQWGYTVSRDKNGLTIEWYNNNVEDGRQIAILIQYGHATGTGGYVVGRDYINPAIQPIFDEILDDLWKQVRK